MHASEILQLISQCCLLGRFAKMLYLIVRDLDQKFMLCMSHEHCIHSREAKISSLSIESTYLLNLSFSSCLHLRTMCSFSLILRTTMIFERMFTIGFVAITHVDVSRNCLKNLDVDQTRGSNQKRCTTMFRSPRFKNEGHPDTWSHGNLAVLTANGRARITWVCSHIGLRPYPVGIMHFASASVMKGVLQSIINDVFNGAFV